MNKDLLKSKLSEVSHAPSSNSWSTIEAGVKKQMAVKGVTSAAETITATGSTYLVAIGLVILSVLAFIANTYYSSSRNTKTVPKLHKNEFLNKNDVSDNSDSIFIEKTNPKNRQIQLGEETSQSKKVNEVPKSDFENIVGKEIIAIESKEISDIENQLKLENEVEVSEIPKTIPKNIKYVIRRDTIIALDTLKIKNKK